MPLPQEKIVDLVIQHLAGTLTDAGREELEAWMNASDENREMVSEFFDEPRVKAELQHLFEVKDRVWEKIGERTGGKVVRMTGNRKWWLYAASIALLVTSAAVFLLYDRQPAAVAPVAGHQEPPADVPTPAHTNAYITLGNGKKVYIDSVQNGNRLLPGGQPGQKVGNDRIAFNGAPGSRPELQRITVPEGSKPLQVVLPDGSRLWLNVASTASFHVPFDAKERAVAITGEAYFEVAHEASRPFTVKSRGQVIKVLGTAFNVNSYENESTIKTTLVKGNIQLSQTASGATKILSAGQQATATPGGDIHLEPDADVDEALAWKQNVFQFKNEELRSIMRQIGRWYGVEVRYADGVPERFFTANISRDKSLSTVLKIMELNDIHFRLEGKTLTVMP